LTLLALFADIHGNREALDACLADAGARGAENFVFLGDLVGYGADPAYVVDLVAEKQRRGAIAVLGNHDAAVFGSVDSMNAVARASVDWTRQKLGKDRQNFLARLPLTAARDEALFVHAGAARPELWSYLTTSAQVAASLGATDKRLIFCGHVHRPQIYHAATPGLPGARTPEADKAIEVKGPAKWLTVLGAVGQPRDENPAAAYALFDEETEKLTFVRVRYDIAAAARKIYAAGLPEILAARLFVGR
jgi:diadenosine tetraphosphatase ApaH/serine/threonine PP2A family protein phosphatase